MHPFGFLVLLGLFIGSQAVTLRDLLDALNTTETTWLKRRTYNMSGHTCVYIKKTYLNETNYGFEQGYRVGEKLINHTLYAKLGQGNATDPWMTVHHSQGTLGIKYFLQYWNRTEKCGILKVHQQGQDQYEMHKWNSTVEEEGSECTKKYEGLRSGKHTYEIYSRSCRSGNTN